MLEDVSIIIPLAPDENAHRKLLDDLKNTKAEIILRAEGTRAKSMNKGAALAQNRFLWFLHADSRINDKNIHQLDQSLQKHPDDLHYFSLVFDRGGIVTLNAWGANLRSYFFGVPYGDQGFCISKQNFEKAGFYRENLDLAEDLAFVWQARQNGIKLKRIASKIKTSARKYKQHGWLKLTALYQWIWIKKSLPEAWKLMKGKA